MQFTRSRALTFVYVAACLTLPMLEGCGVFATSEKPDDKKDKPAPAAETKPPETKRAYPVRVQVVTTQPVRYEIRAVGDLEANDTYRIEARVPGTLYDVDFKEGDKVTRDRVLCKIAPEAYRLTALKQKAIYDQAISTVADTKRKLLNDIDRKKVQLREAVSELARRKEIREVGGISNEEIQIYESRRDLAQVELKDATEAVDNQIAILEAAVVEKESMWKIAEDDVRKSIVMPPIDGIIEMRAATSGMFAQPQMLLATMVDRSVLKLKFKISEKDSSVVKIGTHVDFQVSAYPNDSFEAEVYHVGDQLDPEARILTCWAKVTKGVEKLRPGYFASARILTVSHDKGVVVPSTALLPTEKGFAAFIVVDNKSVKRMLKVGLTVSDNSIEVLSGLNEGEVLVVQGANSLLDNVPVRILTDEQPKPAAK